MINIVVIFFFFQASSDVLYVGRDNSNYLNGTLDDVSLFLCPDFIFPAGKTYTTLRSFRSASYLEGSLSITSYLQRGGLLNLVNDVKGIDTPMY